MVDKPGSPHDDHEEHAGQYAAEGNTTVCPGEPEHIENNPGADDCPRDLAGGNDAGGPLGSFGPRRPWS